MALAYTALILKGYLGVPCTGYGKTWDCTSAWSTRRPTSYCILRPFSIVITLENEELAVDVPMGCLGND